MKKLNLDRTRAIGLVRVSTQDQELGISSQRAKLQAFATAQGLTLVQIVEERVSGAAPIEERKGLFLAMSEMRAQNAGVLLFASRDRIARDVLVAGLIGQAVTALSGTIMTADGMSAHEDGAAKLIRTILDAVSEFERHMIRTRTSAALQQKKAKGELVGSVPYGFRLSPDRRSLEIDPREQEVIAAARDMRKHGQSLRDIADNLWLMGYRPRSGKDFHKTQVSRMLQFDSAVPVGHPGQDPEVHEGPGSDPVS